MRKILAIVLFSVFITGGIFVEARSGCCSWHGGVRSDGCGCNDGSALSATCAPYYSCSSGYSGNNYSNYTPSYAPTTHTCPSMATYDSLSGSCKCMSGYVVDSTGSSCISGNSYCWNKMGYGSSFDSFSKKCTCSSGYKLDNTGQCVSNETYCTNSFGYGAEYSYLKSQCVCKSGYSFNSTTNKCGLDASAYSGPSYYPTTTVSCPTNAYSSNGSCYCTSGYELNYNKTTCVPVTQKKVGCYTHEYTQDDGSCTCKFGNGLNGLCLTSVEKCKLWNGEHSYSTTNNDTNCVCEQGYVLEKNKCILYGDSQQFVPPVSSAQALKQDTSGSCTGLYGTGSYSKNSLCYCSSGYQWNTPINQCIKSNMTLSKSLKTGSSGIEVVVLKNFLANQGLYSEKVNTPYDATTTLAVKEFQRKNGILQTGTVGPSTRVMINKLMISK